MRSRVSVLGIGAVTPVGRDLEVIRQAVVEGGSSEGAIRPVDDRFLVDTGTASAMRRADRFTRMAFLAARDAWESSKEFRAGVPAERIGLILSSGFGPHCRGFKFLDGILDEGDMAASPTDFSHSVHGAASAYISRLLEIRGPALNVTDFEIGFEETIRMAQCWLEEGACDRVLVGAVEELGAVLLSCVSRMGGEEKGISPGEGAVFLMLGAGEMAGVGHVKMGVEDPDVFHSRGREPWSDAGDGKNPRLPPHAIKEGLGDPGIVSFTPVFGHSASSTAFSVLGALLILDNIDTAATLRTSSEGRGNFLILEK